METMNFGDQQAGPVSGGTSQDNNAAPKAPRNKRLIWAGIILAALILSVIGWQYWQYVNSPYYKQMKAVKEINRQIEESDKWGGKTPEETVKLFTEAVKNGDFELAGKYGDPIKIIPELKQMKIEGKLNQLISDLENGKLEMTPGFNENAADLIVMENNQRIHILGLFKSDGETWKIVEF